MNIAEKVRQMPRESKVSYLNELIALDYLKAERSFAHYFRASWRVLEPITPLLWNWHQELIAEHLEAVYHGDIRRLIINIPPRYSKSMLATVMFPTWVWAKNPSFKFICTSYAEQLSTKHSIDRRELMNSPWYQGAPWARKWKWATDQNQKHSYKNDQRGVMFSTSMLGQVTGTGSDCIICDDPHNPVGAESEAKRLSAIKAWDGTFTSRLDDKQNGRMIVIMQRLHSEDLTGHLLAKGGWTHLKIPAESPKTIVYSFPRTKKVKVYRRYEVLHPEREDREGLKAVKAEMGSYNYAGQYDQEPAPREGGLFKRSYWNFFHKKPDKFDEMIQSWDMTFKDLETSDYVVGFTLGRVGADIYVLDRFREKAGLVASCEAVRKMSKKWKLARRKCIENKANGPGVVDVLKKEITGLVLVEPQGDKQSRAIACEPTCEAGNIWLPSPEVCDWTEEFITELAQFPRAPHDDQVDAFTQGVLELENKSLERARALTRM